MLVLCVLCGGCGFYGDSFKPEVLAEKKILASRKAEIIRNGRVEMIMIATYLNNVNPQIYHTREYFFLEVFSQNDAILPESMAFGITDDAQFLWIREVEKDEFDEVINVSNRWSRGFLVAFDSIDEYSKRNLALNVAINALGEMRFDFAYQVFEMQL